MADVIVIGGGAIGCACAWALAKRGIGTELVERDQPGAGASGAAAGVLAAQSDARRDDPIVRLGLASRERFPAWAAELYEQTGVDVELRICGVTHVGADDADLDALSRGVDWQRDSGLPVELLDAKQLHAIEPGISDAAGAVRFPIDGRIDPPRFVRALELAATRAGVKVRRGAGVRRIVVGRDRVEGVALDDATTIQARAVVVAAGSWSHLIDAVPIGAEALRPARGQIVELRTVPPLLRGVAYGPSCYLSPRDDGRVLVGSTVEFVGHRSGVTAAAVRNLLDAALRLVPALEGASDVRCWSGLRPCTADELPAIGRTEIDGLVVATGHFRSGILLAPITAEIVVAALVGETLVGVDASAFDPARLR